jgi:hypothetical protein
MWELVFSADYEKRAKRYAKTNRQELLNVADNLAAYLSALRNGLKPQQIIRGFVHDEPLNVKALDESGPGKHKKALRLYIYPNEFSETLHVLTLGDKNKQREDIKQCIESVKALLKSDRSQDNSDY